MMVEVLTDNRTADVRHVVTKGGGSLADAGSVAYLFSRRGLLVVLGDGVDEDRVMEVALEAGAEDVEADEQGFTVTTALATYGRSEPPSTRPASPMTRPRSPWSRACRSP